MRELVSDRVAQEFLKYFLAAFAKGQSLYQSVRLAWEQLDEMEGQFPWASWLPVLCQNPAQNLPVDTCIASPEDTNLPSIAISPQWSQDTELASTQRHVPTLLFYVFQSTETEPSEEFIL